MQTFIQREIKQKELNNNDKNTIYNERTTISNLILISSKKLQNFEKNEKQLNETNSTGVSKQTTQKLNVKNSFSKEGINNYSKKENKNLLGRYGPELFYFAKDLEVLNCDNNFFENHKIERQTRIKMVDWIIEVLSAYHSEPITFFLTMHLFDYYLSKTKQCVTNQDVHLLGLTCMFIASKMEDILPLRMSLIKNKIAHGKFVSKEIKAKEKEILETVEFDVIICSPYEFIKTFVFDFCHNNEARIKALNLEKHIDAFDNAAIYLAKLMFHDEEFSSHK
jgi:hypothetical protein